MNFIEKKRQLQNLINNSLLPLIDDDYWFLELPYHQNIGDILIWEGTEYLLKTLDAQCKYKASFHTFKPKRILSDTIIMLQGGGNFGDLWITHHEFRKKIIKEYPNNKIIILPQTVFYSNNDNLRVDAELFNNHKDLTICARDKKSYDFLKKHFNAKILLVPDMAFCIPGKALEKYQYKKTDKTLFFKRTDSELNIDIDYMKYINSTNIDIHDWPSMEKTIMSYYLLIRCLGIGRRTNFQKLADLYAAFLFKPDMIKKGVQLISKYEKVYTTRLHAAILCCLLEKPFIFFDNTYGKNSSFFETWLNDLDEVEFH
jgi:pyruvyl transferase EpsO